jgi:hypothetical protein
VFTIRLSGSLLVVAALAGCANAPADTPASSSSDRVAALHAAAECLRQHGINNFADPVLGANGQVFTDARPLQDAGDTATEAASNGCHDLLGAANWNPGEQPPAPPALVAAGVKAAQCMRAHGLPMFRDPTATTPYTPGHGFGMSAEDLPPGADKGTPAVRQARDACHVEVDSEISASALNQLAGK